MNFLLLIFEIHTILVLYSFSGHHAFSTGNTQTSISTPSQQEKQQCDYTKLKLPPDCAIKTDSPIEYPFIMVECSNIFSESEWCKKNAQSPACKPKKTKIFSTACKPNGAFKDNIAFSNIFGKLLGFNVPDGCESPRFENGYIVLECLNSKDLNSKEVLKTPLFFSPFFKFKHTPYFLSLENGLKQIYIPERCTLQDLIYEKDKLSFSCADKEKNVKQHTITVDLENRKSSLVTTFFEKITKDIITVWHPYECLVMKHHNNSDLYINCEPDQNIDLKTNNPDGLLKERNFFQLFTSENTKQLLVTKSQGNNYRFWDIPSSCNAASAVFDNEKLTITCMKTSSEFNREGLTESLDISIPPSSSTQNVCHLRQIEDHQKQMKLTAPCNKGALSHMLPQKCLAKHMKLENNSLTVSCYDKNMVLVQNIVPIICDCLGNPINTIFTSDESGMLISKNKADPS
ncbi:MAG: hypothetical protein C0440_03435 [Candidatus Pelagibacter sp.]|nr:hypothetical protein [Candidatus Pelagibacter sp.]